MARTNIPITDMTGASGSPTIVLNSAGTAIDQANGMNVAPSLSTIPAGTDMDRIILYVQNTAAATKTVTVRKGDNTNYQNVPAWEAAKGDVTTGNMTASTGSAFIGPFDIARFQQSGAAGSDQPAGSFNVDFSSGTTGLIWAIRVARSF